MDNTDQEWNEFQRSVKNLKKATSLREQLNVISAQLNEIEQDTKNIQQIKDELLADQNAEEAMAQDPTMMDPTMMGMNPAGVTDPAMMAQDPNAMMQGGQAPPMDPGMMKSAVKKDVPIGAEPSEPIADAVNMDTGDEKVQALFNQLIQALSESAHVALDSGDIARLMKLTNVQSNLSSLMNEIAPLLASVPENVLGGGEPIAKSKADPLELRINPTSSKKPRRAAHRRVYNGGTSAPVASNLDREQLEPEVLEQLNKIQRYWKKQERAAREAKLRDKITAEFEAGKRDEISGNMGHRGEMTSSKLDSVLKNIKSYIPHARMSIQQLYETQLAKEMAARGAGTDVYELLKIFYPAYADELIHKVQEYSDANGTPKFTIGQIIASDSLGVPPQSINQAQSRYVTDTLFNRLSAALTGQQRGKTIVAGTGNSTADRMMRRGTYKDSDILGKKTRMMSQKQLAGDGGITTPDLALLEGDIDRAEMQGLIDSGATEDEIKQLGRSQRRQTPFKVMLADDIGNLGQDLLKERRGIRERVHNMTPVEQLQLILQNDQRGRFPRKFSLDPQGYITQFGPDALSRVVQALDPEGNKLIEGLVPYAGLENDPGFLSPERRNELVDALSKAKAREQKASASFSPDMSPEDSSEYYDAVEARIAAENALKEADRAHHTLLSGNSYQGIQGLDNELAQLKLFNPAVEEYSDMDNQLAQILMDSAGHGMNVKSPEFQEKLLGQTDTYKKSNAANDWYADLFGRVAQLQNAYKLNWKKDEEGHRFADRSYMDSNEDVYNTLATWFQNDPQRMAYISRFRQRGVDPMWFAHDLPYLDNMTKWYSGPDGGALLGESNVDRLIEARLNPGLTAQGMSYDPTAFSFGADPTELLQPDHLTGLKGAHLRSPKNVSERNAGQSIYRWGKGMLGDERLQEIKNWEKSHPGQKLPQSLNYPINSEDLAQTNAEKLLRFFGNLRQDFNTKDWDLNSEHPLAQYYQQYSDIMDNLGNKNEEYMALQPLIKKLRADFPVNADRSILTPFGEEWKALSDQYKDVVKRIAEGEDVDDVDLDNLELWKALNWDRSQAEVYEDDDKSDEENSHHGYFLGVGGDKTPQYNDDAVDRMMKELYIVPHMMITPQKDESGKRIDPLIELYEADSPRGGYTGVQYDKESGAVFGPVTQLAKEYPYEFNSAKRSILSGAKAAVMEGYKDDAKQHFDFDEYLVHPEEMFKKKVKPERVIRPKVRFTAETKPPENPEGGSDKVPGDEHVEDAPANTSEDLTKPRKKQDKSVDEVDVERATRSGGSKKELISNINNKGKKKGE